MLLQDIELTNFRSYRNLSIQVPPEGCLFFGANGSGKTNFFEAISVCLTGKSIRNSLFREMVFVDEREANITANFSDNLDNKTQNSVGFSKNNDTILSIDGVKQKNFSSFYGKNGFVYFGVDDIKTVRGVPQEKRQFIDMTISQKNLEYLKNIIEYKNLIRQRNFVLSTNFEHNLIDIYDEQIAIIAMKVMKDRKKFFDYISPISTEYYEDISNSDIPLNLQYLPSVECETEEEYYIIQKQNIKKDRELKYTSMGIHRDNFEFKTNNIKFMNFASQGQCKSAAVALKLASVEYLSKDSSDIIIVIDDAFSDLDILRKQKFFEILDKKGQIFIAVHSYKELDYYPLENYFEINYGSMRYCSK